MILFNHDIEKLVLSKILYQPEVMYDIEAMFNPNHFTAFKVYAEGIKTLHSIKHPITGSTLTTYLTNKKLHFSPQDIELLEFSATNPTSIDRDLLFIHELYLKREGITKAQELERSINEGIDIFEALDTAERNINAITEGISGNNISSIKDLYARFKLTQEQIELNNGVNGLLTGVESIDRILKGFKAPDYIVIAGRPAMGKTALVVTLAKNISINLNKPVGIFSLEMSNDQLFTRMVSAETAIPTDEIFNGLNKYQLESVEHYLPKLISSNLYFDDTAGLKLSQFKQKARRMVNQYHVELIIIDYLQLMTGDGKSSGNRESEISEISRGIKKIAKELNVPIIALSQLSRAVESRADKIPMLSDLRESGSIEQDADIVGMLFRPEYYGIKQDEMGNDTTGKGYLIISKHRNGKLGWCPMNFIPHLTKFESC